VLTALLPDPSHYGRIVMNGYIDGYRQVEKIVESKDASSEELEIKEINSGFFYPTLKASIHRKPHQSLRTYRVKMKQLTQS
ncbi:unnamed protein product, partial [marine sediment metagenome]